MDTRNLFSEETIRGAGCRSAGLLVLVLPGSVAMMTTFGEEEDPSGLDDIVSMLLTASRTLVAISASSLEEVEDMLTLSEFRALVVLQAQGPCRAIGLARRLGVGPETGERVSARLVAGDFVVCDRREILQLSQRGEDIVSQVTSRRRLALTRVVERMNVAERRLLVDALIAFARAAGEPLVVEAGSAYPGPGEP